MSESLRFRHVHLDFHTHGAIRGIGRDFSRKQFQSALQAGHVNSINLFSKCHHGWSYHPTEVGWTHPGLDFDLLGEQIAACREIGVRAPIYVSAGLDEAYLDHFPGDVAVKAIPRKQPFTEPGYNRLCFRSAYLDHLCRQIEEIAARYGEVDGWWFDIVGPVDCVCRRCRAEMERQDLDPENPNHIRRLAIESRDLYLQRVSDTVRRVTPDAGLVHNAGHVSRGDRTFVGYQSHIELESLPTGNWGYDHFPLSARYAITLGPEFLGMTGKFHTVWGEFGGYKHDNALRYECAAMLASGARCAIGDQLPPAGELDADTYRKIGLAYAEVEAKEPWCTNVESVAEIAILSQEAMSVHGRELGAHLADRNMPGDTGAARALLERQVPFDLIDTEADFTRYRLLILPDTIRLGGEMAERLRAYVDQGGKLLLSGESGLARDDGKFLLPVGQWHGRTGTDMDYFKASPALLERDTEGRLVKAPFVLEGNSCQVTPPADAEIFAELWHSQFNRHIYHFCGHQHAPADHQSDHPAAFVTAEGAIGYVASDIFRQYFDRGQMLYRDLIWLLLDRLLDADWQMRVALPSMGRANLLAQDTRNRHILHLLYASPIQRPQNAFPRWAMHKTEIIEDIVPLHDVACELRLSRDVKSVRLVPSGEEIPFETTGDRVRFTVPKVECHQMVEIS